MAVYVMRLVAFTGIRGPQYHPMPPAGAYLADYDPDAHDGRGAARWTLDVDDAMHFASFQAVMDCWKLQSTVRPLRPDGNPNRPLPAATIMPVAIQEALP